MSPEILEELVALRRQDTERESLISTNQYYMAQLAELEMQVSGLMVQLKNKTKELEDLKQLEKPGSKETTRRLDSLESENKELASRLEKKQKLQQLQLELKHTQFLNEMYEKKYREVSGKTLNLREEETLNQEILTLKHTYTEQLKMNTQLNQEKDYIKNEIIPMLKEQMVKEEKEKVKLERNIENAKDDNIEETSFDNLTLVKSLPQSSDGIIDKTYTRRGSYSTKVTVPRARDFHPKNSQPRLYISKGR